MHDTLNRRIATSMLTLPGAGLLAAALWAAGGVTAARLGGFAAALAAVCMVAELNNRFALTRVRSRMMSGTLALALGLAPALQAWSPGALVPVGLLAATGCMLGGYGRRREAGPVFHAMLALSLTGFLFPPLWLLAPVWMLSMGLHLQMLSWRNLMAAICGLAVPWWLGGVWLLWRGETAAAADFAAAWAVAPPGPGNVAQWGAATLARVGLLAAGALVALVHLGRTVREEKPRPRFSLRAIGLQWAAAAALLALWPSAAAARAYTLYGAMLAGHYFATAAGRGAARWFGFCLLAAGALAATQLYGPWKP